MLKKVLSVVLSAAMLLPTFGLNAAGEATEVQSEILLTASNADEGTVNGDTIDGGAPGNYALFNDVDFGSGTYTKVEINAQLRNIDGGQNTEVKIGGSNGTTIAQFMNHEFIEQAGNENSPYDTYTMDISAQAQEELKGVQDIYMSFSNWGTAYVKSIRFFNDQTSGGEGETAEIVNLDPIINSAEVWKNISGTEKVTSQDGKLTVPGGWGTVVGYADEAQEYHNKLLKFKVNLNLESGWYGFYTRQQARDKMFWEGEDQSCYGVVFKKDTIEIQKGGTKEYLDNIPNTFVTSNETAEIVFGAVDVENGVRVFLSVNGVIVYDGVDQNNPYTKAGSFVVYSFGNPTIMEAVEGASEDGTVNLDPIINSAEGWTPAENVQTADGKLTVTGQVTAYADTAKEFHNKLLHFKLNTGLDSGEWPGIYVRHKDTGAFWSGPEGDCYGVVFKKETIELQKGMLDSEKVEPDQQIIMTAENTFVQSNVTADIVFGAVDVENGVRLFLSVDGKTVFDYVDTENPYQDPGSIAVYGWMGPVTLEAIEGGSGTEPTPTPEPTPDPEQPASETSYPRAEDNRPEKVIEYDLDGTIYYVSADGKADGNGTKENPWNSIAYALSVVPANQDATIFVQSGTYVEEKPLVLKSGTNLIGENRETTIVKTVDGVSGIYQQYGTGNILAGLTFDGENNGDTAVSFYRSRNSIITDLFITRYNQAFSLSEVKDGDFYNVYVTETYGNQAGLSGDDCKFHDMVFDCYLPEPNSGWGIDIGTQSYAYNWDLYDLSVRIPFRGSWNVGNGYYPPSMGLESCGGNIENINVYNCDFNNTVSLVPNANSLDQNSLSFHNNILRLATGETYGFEVTAGLTNCEIYENLVLGGSHIFSNWDGGNLNGLKVYRNIFDMVENGQDHSHLLLSLGSHYTNLVFQNNTIIAHEPPAGSNKVMWVENSPNDQFIYQNNILVYDHNDEELPAEKNALNATEAIVENNLFWKLAAFSQGINNITADPKFVGEGNSMEKYALTEGSPAIDAGMNLEGHEVADGKTDLGALEYGEEPFKVGPYQEGYKPVNQFNFNGEDFDGNLPDWRDTIDSVVFVDTYIGWKDTLEKVEDETLMDYYSQYDELNLVEDYYVDPKAFGGIQYLVKLKDGSYDGMAGYTGIDGVSVKYTVDDESVMKYDASGEITVVNGGITNLNVILMSGDKEVGRGSARMVTPAKNYDEKHCYMAGSSQDAWQYGSAAGTSIVGFVDREGAGVEYHVNVPESGEYKLVLRYNGGYTDGGSEYDVSVNGEYVMTTSIMGTGSWSPPFGHYEFTLQLQKGKNDIYFDWVSRAVNFEGLSVYPVGQTELNLADLDKGIADAKLLKEENFAADAWQPFAELLEKTIAYREAGEFVSQQEIDDAYFDLRAMYLELDKTYRQAVGVVIKSRPDKMTYAEGEKLDLSGLAVIITNNDRTKTEFDWEEFEKYGITTNLEAGTPLSIESHDGMTIVVTVNGVSIETAPISVVEGPVVNKSDLSDLVEKAEGLDTDDYTEESVKVLKDAIAAAKAVLADEAATQEQVDAQVEALKAALEGLEKKDDSSSSGKPDDGTSEGNSSGEEGTDSPATGDTWLFILTGLGLMILSGTAMVMTRRKKNADQ